jgi:hypothetical protein
MTFTELELVDWALRTAREEYPTAEAAELGHISRSLVIGYIFGVRTTLKHLKYATDIRRVEGLLTDAEKARRFLSREG